MWWVTEGGVEYWAAAFEMSKNKYNDLFPVDHVLLQFSLKS